MNSLYSQIVIAVIDGANIMFETLMIGSMLAWAGVLGCALVVVDHVFSVFGFFLDPLR